MAISHEAKAEIQLYRQKAREGNLTTEDLRHAIALLREDRMSAQAASTKSKTTKAAKAAINSDSLLDEIDNL